MIKLGLSTDINTESNEGDLDEVDKITDNNDSDFIESATFNGIKDGYVFKTDSQGTGYYKDTNETTMEEVD